MRWALILTLAVAPVTGIPIHAADNDQVDWGENYASGNKLHNLNRLTQGYDGFETSVQQKRTTKKEAESYLLNIRNEISTKTKKQAEERTALNYASNLPDSALNVTYIEKGYIQVTLRTKYLFDENTAFLKSNSMDVINRLIDLLNSKDKNRIELTMVDELDDTHNVSEIDAERALLVFSLLHFKS